jgi:dolichol-phosphate mannosyltransferase
MNPDILVIIPTYNERETIGVIIPDIIKAVPGAHVLVVDDGSPDGTSAYVKETFGATGAVFVLDRSKKDGLGRAYIDGFGWALERSYRYIFEMDADYSHDPKYLPDFLKAIESNDLVIGSRYISGVNVINWPMSRLLLSYFANLFARVVTGITIKDCTSGFKCFRREVLEALDLGRVASSGYSFQIEINYTVWKKKFRLAEIPIVFTDRRRGASKMSGGIVREAFLLVFWKLFIASFINRKK